jgi:nucleotide sugar dehydrogenase
MRVQIAGLGVVGKAQAHLMRKMGHTVTGYDVKPVSFPEIQVTNEPVVDADLTFICPPEKAVPGVLDYLVKSKVHNPYVIKSTIPPGTSQTLMQEYGVHICHNPEFLREETAFEDVMKQKFIIIGECCPKHGDLLADVYAPLGAKIIRTHSNISETAKLVLNNYLSTLITFWNEVDKLCAILKIDTEDVAEIVKNDERISEYGTSFFGQPFSGKCLPKDLNQLLTLCYSHGFTPKLFETLKEVNTELSLLENNRRQRLVEESEAGHQRDMENRVKSSSYSNKSREFKRRLQ